MLRLNQSVGDPVTIIALDGKLTAPWIPALSDAVSAARGRGAVRLNLAGLIFTDHEGAALLRVLRADGVEMFGASPFLAALLADPGPSHGPARPPRSVP